MARTKAPNAALEKRMKDSQANLAAANKGPSDMKQSEVVPPSAGPGRPSSPTVNRTSSKNRGLQEGLERFTVAVDSNLLERLKDYAYTERLSIKDTVNAAFEQFLADKTDLLSRPK